MAIKKYFNTAIALILIIPFFIMSCTSPLSEETSTTPPLETPEKEQSSPEEETEQDPAGSPNDSPGITTETVQNQEQELDIEAQREYFTSALTYFEEGNYLATEYYLNKIKDKYKILQDYTFYYLAKSLLMQEKYQLAGKYYSLLIETFPDSVWIEKATLEYADLYYLQEDYITAEGLYQNFIQNFGNSSHIPYSLFQLSICNEKTNKIDQAYENYKKIWLQYPENEYADTSYSRLQNLIDENELEPFIPSAEQIYNRAEIFFDDYNYNDAVEEINFLLSEYTLLPELESQAYFKLGMSYYNLRNYSQAKEYLQECYNISQGMDLADDSLYFLARAETNLGENEKALSYYDQLVANFPQSNFSDDSLYRAGRIYFFQDNLEKAIEKYTLVVEKYPNGDRLSEVLWELGWIHYTLQDYQTAMNIFTNMANSFKSTTLEEKGLFWKAQCLKNMGRVEEATEIYKNIVNLNSYSYYTFISKEILKTMDHYLRIPPVDKAANPQNSDIEQKLPKVYSILRKDIEEIDTSVHIEKALELLKLDLLNNASIEIEAGKDEIENFLTLSTLFLESEDYYNCINIVIKNSKELKYNLEGLYKDYYYYLAYPYGYRDLVVKYASKYGVDPLFILAVMRQESHFKSDAHSYAGAKGLMQIMPATGSSIAPNIGITNFNTESLYDPEISIMMGSYYISQQLNNFNHNKFYALGAYNGGPGAMSSWISKWGDKDIFEFVENIPYSETKHYIKVVMENYYLYKMLYD
ncbi:MAG: tetratricopeptide repeat protein [Actinomycetota bacterium]